MSILECLVGLFLGFVAADVMRLVIDGHASAPLTRMFDPIQASVTILVVSLGLIGAILDMSSSAQVAPSIVGWISVDVVDEMSRPLSGLVSPYKLVCPDGLIKEPDFDSAVLGRDRVTGNVADFHSATTDAPAQFAGFGVVREMFAHKFWINVRHADIVLAPLWSRKV